MKILFDNGTPKPIAACLTGHEITYARLIGWHKMGNGELIQQAEEAGYDVLLSTDKNIRYQQNLAKFRIAILQLSTNDIRRIRAAADIIRSAIVATKPNEFQELVIP